MSSIPPSPIVWHAICSPVEVYLASGNVRAGFPSSADDFDCRPVDLAHVLIKHPQATFLVRGRGRSMLTDGINDNDLLIVDRAREPKHMSVVCAVVDNMFTVKYLHTRGKTRLVAADPTFPDIVLQEGQDLIIWGVVTASITQL